MKSLDESILVLSKNRVDIVLYDAVRYNMVGFI